MRILAAIAILPAALMAGTASGSITIDGHKVTVKHAYAVQFPDWFDKSKLATRIVVSDADFPETAMQDESELRSLVREDKINAIQFEIGADRSSIAMSILSNKLGGSLSSSTNFDAATVPVFTATRIEGALAKGPSELGSMKYQYDVKFAAAIAPRIVAAPPTAADQAAAAKSASARAYLEWVAAVRAGNKAKMLDLAAPAVRKMIDRPEFAESLSLVQQMMAKDIKVLRATETGDEAKLDVSGKEGAKTVKGTVTMMRQNGKWHLVKESWKSEA